MFLAVIAAKSMDPRKQKGPHLHAQRKTGAFLKAGSNFNFSQAKVAYLSLPYIGSELAPQTFGVAGWLRRRAVMARKLRADSLAPLVIWFA